MQQSATKFSNSPSYGNCFQAAKPVSKITTARQWPDTSAGIPVAVQTEDHCNKWQMSS